MAADAPIAKPIAKQRYAGRRSYGTFYLTVAPFFAIFGPQVLLVGTTPTDLSKRGTAAAAAGFVNFMGYMGAFTGDVVTGNLLKREYGLGWQVAIWVWAAWAFLGALPWLLRELDHAGVEVQAADVRVPTLDDVFLSLTGRSLREESEVAS